MDGIFVFVKCRISLLRHFLIHRRRFEIMSNLLFPTKIPLFTTIPKLDDEKHARVFYKYVMGGGGFDIHYGIFRKPTDTVYEASKATNDRLLTCLDWTHPVTKDSYVLDLGSGHGGISHEVRWNGPKKIIAIVYQC